MNEVKKLQRKSDKHYKFISDFVNDYCKNDKERIEFFKHLNRYLEAEIELEGICNE